MSVDDAFAMTLLVELSRVKGPQTLRIGLQDAELRALRSTSLPIARVLKGRGASAYVRLCYPGFKHGVWILRGEVALPLYDIRRHALMVPQYLPPTEEMFKREPKEYGGLPFCTLPNFDTYQSVDYENKMFPTDVEIAPSNYPASSSVESSKKNFATNCNSVPKQAARAAWGTRKTNIADYRSARRASDAARQAAYEQNRKREDAAREAVAALKIGASHERDGAGRDGAE